MTKDSVEKQNIARLANYQLLILFNNAEQAEGVCQNLQIIIGDSFKKENKENKPAYEIKAATNPLYVFISFSLDTQRVIVLKESLATYIQSGLVNRYSLINLKKEPKQEKQKPIKKIQENN